GAAGTGLSLHPLPAADELAALVAALVEENVLHSTPRSRALGAAAYARLLAPLAGRLRGKDLLIVPNGPLCRLPFELLVEGEGEQARFLAEAHRVRYAPSLTVLHLSRLWDRARPRPERPLWAVGDPVYQADDERLPATAALSATSQQAAAAYQRRAGEG